MSTETRKTALITGASSGIGEAFAHQLAASGYRLILVARRADRLQQLAEELSSLYQAPAQILEADLTVEEDLKRVEDCIRDVETLYLLVNNAGFGLVGSFAKIELEEHLRMIQLHVTASVRLAHAALPSMIAHRSGGIINVSSVAAFVQWGNITYHSTKAFLVAFSQSLHGELAGKGVHVQALCPGFTRTEFHNSTELSRIRRVPLPKFLWLPADYVVKESLKALDRNQVVCIPSIVYRVIAILGRSSLTAPLVNLVVARLRRNAY